MGKLSEFCEQSIVNGSYLFGRNRKAKKKVVYLDVSVFRYQTMIPCLLLKSYNTRQTHQFNKLWFPKLSVLVIIFFFYIWLIATQFEIILPPIPHINACIYLKLATLFGVISNILRKYILLVKLKNMWRMRI